MPHRLKHPKISNNQCHTMHGALWVGNLNENTAREGNKNK